MIRIIETIHHVCSQLAFRWFRSRDYSEVVTTGDDYDIFQLGEEDWRDLIFSLRAYSLEELSWLDAWLTLRDPSAELLAAGLVRHLSALRREGGAFLTLSDENYPESLRFIPDPPLGLSVLGDASLLRGSCVSIIGSRKASAFALKESSLLGQQLAEHGSVVVSGGAIGCDIAAHFGALKSGITSVPTICVMAGGLDRFYPFHNLWVFDQLRERGAVFLSERLWWMPCYPRDFAIRNRIISGMARATCVMQASQKSGALLTARHALNHGRDVLVLRHPEYDARAEGGAALIDDGASAFSSAEEFIWALHGAPS